MNLRECHEWPFTARIEGRDCEGKISVQYNTVYLCQDVKNGSRCDDTLGYKHSWNVSAGTEDQLRRNDVKNFKLIKPTDKPVTGMDLVKNLINTPL